MARICARPRHQNELPDGAVQEMLNAKPAKDANKKGEKSMETIRHTRAPTKPHSDHPISRRNQKHDPWRLGLGGLAALLAVVSRLV